MFVMQILSASRVAVPRVDAAEFGVVGAMHVPEELPVDSFRSELCVFNYVC